ncbi:lytic polysaccharide monooxygenase [Francisella tularensis]|uniref:lytic polysaccharide monooxygenase n=1 Tax=Francisella tularensis TaxID=263 RepID=UPI000185532C|nr:lytic polysaccharide monooxygenase [Francisella tularensis]APC94608.1 chitin binding domain protein [Francisella tularensis subsp. novicida]EDZ90600.1 chitin binding domain protein [Francisella tularensis subsp. novicida FTG]MBK2335326.1 lytic polysaccharide monooxygenase [Francisella tularensis subsp. novicida]MBK2346411.1 lytic polysaccharide monooxygenase [Francisella tularensis subsp. novicida]
MKLNKITLLTGLALLVSSEAYSHGYVESPASRALLCKEGKNKDCGERAQYEPQSIEQADELFNLGALDNNIGSADVAGFEPLDEQEQSRWAKTVVQPGQPLKIKWQFTANHKSKHFKFYITKPNWDPNKLLTRESFEEKPLNCYDPQPTWVAPNQPPKDGLTFTCTMPNRSGYQIIMAEWDVDDTRMSFYNLLDLDFTTSKPAGTVILPDGSSSNNNGSQPSTTSTYDPSKSYPTPGTEVVFDGKVYQNKWYVNPGQQPGAEQWGPWAFVRDHQQQNNPSDKFPLEATKFTINPLNIKEGDKITLQVFKDGTMTDYPLLTVPKAISTNDLFLELTEKINKISTEQLNNQIIAGVKDSNNAVIPNGNAVYIYQTADKPYDQISFYYHQANQNLKNELHLMDFKDQYNISSDGKLYINAKIMSHSSANANVTVVLQDQNGNQVYRKTDIQISPMDTYDLALAIDNIKAGNYKLIISSELAGAEAWQKDMNIKAVSSETSDDNNNPPPANQDINVNIESNTPYYQVNPNDSVTARAWASSLGNINLANNQVTIIAWNKTLQASGNDSSAYVKCPLPKNNQTSITYLVSGDLNNVNCTIK